MRLFIWPPLTDLISPAKRLDRDLRYAYDMLQSYGVTSFYTTVDLKQQQRSEHVVFTDSTEVGGGSSNIKMGHHSNTSERKATGKE